MLQLIYLLLFDIILLTNNSSHSLGSLTHSKLPDGDLLRVGSFDTNNNTDLLFFDSPTNSFKIVKWKKNFTDFEIETVTLLSSNTSNTPITAISKLTNLITYDFNGNGYTDILLYSNQNNTKTFSLTIKGENGLNTKFITLEDTPNSKQEQFSSISLVFDIKSSTAVLLGVYYNATKSSVVIYRLNLDTEKNVLSPKDVFIEFGEVGLSKFNNKQKLENGKLVDIIQNDINGDNISDLLFVYNNTIKVAYGSNVNSANSSNNNNSIKEIKLKRGFDRVMVRNIKRHALPSLIAIKNDHYKTTDELNSTPTIVPKYETAYIDIYHLKAHDSTFYELEDALSKEVSVEGTKETIEVPGVIDTERVTFSDINVEGNLEIVVPMFPNEKERSKDDNNKKEKSGREVRFYERNSSGEYVVIEAIRSAVSVSFLFIDNPILLVSSIIKENIFREIIYPENHYYLRVTSLHVSTFNLNELAHLDKEKEKNLKDRKNNATFNTSCPGTSILFDTRDFKSKEYRASHSITHSNLPYSFELPYLLVGIGPDLNCIDKLMISIPVDAKSLGKKKKWFKEELYGLPNSHYLIHMVDANDPETWEVNLDSKPSSAIAKAILVVFVIISCMGAILCYLKYKERKDDFMVDGITNQIF